MIASSWWYESKELKYQIPLWRMSSAFAKQPLTVCLLQNPEDVQAQGSANAENVASTHWGEEGTNTGIIEHRWKG